MHSSRWARSHAVDLAACFIRLVLCVSVLVAGWFGTRVMGEEGVARVQLLNYEGCIELSNPTARVVLGHHVGGRVLVYERGRENVLYLAPQEADWQSVKDERGRVATAGRFDVGPELLSKRGPALWSGPWTPEVLGPRSARLTSPIDPKSGLQITRDFTLDASSSRLTVVQTVTNRSRETTRHAFWSRTFAKHGGVGIVPLTPSSSRYPNFYTLHQERASANLKPVDPNIRRDGDFLVIDGPPAFPKMGFDSYAGWVAYQTRTNHLFVQKFPVFENRVYAEITGMTLSLWYPDASKTPACEIEPIGPLEVLQPEASASFQVEWWLLDHPFPASGMVNPRTIAEVVARECLSTNQASKQ